MTLQRNLSEYFVYNYVDDMFSFNNEDNRIDLREIYAPIQWVQYETTPAKVKVTPMENYLDLFKKAHSCSLLLYTIRMKLNIILFYNYFIIFGTEVY